MITAKVKKEYSDILRQYVWWIYLEKTANDTRILWGDTCFLCKTEEECFKKLWTLSRPKGFKIVIEK